MLQTNQNSTLQNPSLNNSLSVPNNSETEAISDFTSQAATTSIFDVPGTLPEINDDDNDDNTPVYLPTPNTTRRNNSSTNKTTEAKTTTSQTVKPKPTQTTAAAASSQESESTEETTEEKPLETDSLHSEETLSE